MSRQRQRIYFLICTVLLVVIGIAGWNVAKILLEYRAGEQTYAQIAEISRSGLGNDKPLPNDEAGTRNFSALQEINPDVIAWISIPGTRIDYPVVQGTDNSYYLTHLVTGEWNSSGSIFLDFQAAPDFSNPYSIIYGHNMLNGSMFSDLMDYKRQDFYDAHTKGVLETPGGSWEIYFFSGFVADRDNDVWSTTLVENDFSSWVEQMTKQSCFQSNCIPLKVERILALSTCSYEYDNARFILLGVLQ